LENKSIAGKALETSPPWLAFYKFFISPSPFYKERFKDGIHFFVFSRNKNVLPHTFEMPETAVDSLPYDINVNKAFVLTCNPDHLMKSSKDGRPWKTWVTSNRAGFSGIRRRSQCNGSWLCPNEECVFLKEKKTKNNVQFLGAKREKRCFVCESTAEFIPCPAIKVWEFNKDKTKVTVYHQGTHTCPPVSRKVSETVKAELRDTFQKNHTLTPTQAASNKLVEALKEVKDWDEIDNLAKSLADTRGIEAVKKSSRKDNLGHSFEALADFKAQCDKRDPFFIYKINDERHNKEMSFVFKASTFQANLGISMDRDGDGLLRDQYCYVLLC
jgi:hypothetical protein